MAYTAIGAAQADCSGPLLVIDEHMDATWSASITDLRTRLRTLPDLDACATVRILGAPGSALVEVALPDGRSTVRRVEDPAALAATVEALVTRAIVPTPAPKLTTPVATAPVAPPTVQRSDLSPTRSNERPSERREFSVELGVAAAMHLATSPAYIGYGMAGHGDAVIDHWLFGTCLRWDIENRSLDQKTPAGFNMSSFLLGAFGGHRFDVGRSAVDVTAGPNVVIENQEAYGPTPEGIGGAHGELSVAAALRLFVPRDHSPNFFGLFAAEVYPRRVGRAIRTDPALPALPAWGATLGLGMSWSLL